jgi:broad specificity phosphatase PhoE
VIEPTRRRIYLMRHGSVTYFDDTGRPVIAESVPLNDTGRAQARAAGEWFAGAGVRFDVAIVSGLPRTVETASLVLSQLAKAPPLETMNDLREIAGGKLANIPRGELQRAFTSVFEGVVPGDARFLGGESVDELFARVVPALAAIRARADWQTLLLVLHGGVNRAILSYLLTGKAEMLGGFHQDAGCINAIDLGERAGDVVLRFAGLAPRDALQTTTRATTMEVLFSEFAKSFKSQNHV